MKKQKKWRRMTVVGRKFKPTSISIVRKEWLKKGYELVDITNLCNFKLGNSGWCNDFNEPDDTIYHLQVWYRREQIGAFNGLWWDEKYVFFKGDEEDDFIIFKKCKLIK